MKNIGIYKIKCLANNKVYIGQSVNVNHRLSTHFCMLRSNKHYNKFLQNSFNKYGEKTFTKEVIQECSTREELNYYETYWYEYYCKLLGKENTFNLAHTGNAHNSSDEFKKQRPKLVQKQSEMMKGNKNISCRGDVKIKKSNSLKGRKLSEETKKKISVACIGRPSSFKGKHFSAESLEKLSKSAKRSYEEHPEKRQKLSEQRKGKRTPNKFQVLQYNEEMVLVKKWDFLKDIEIELRFDRHQIKKHANNKTMYKNCYWVYVDKSL